MSSPPSPGAPARSILTRLLIAVSIWCAVSIAVATVALLFLFRDSVSTQVDEELNSQLIQLVSLTEPDGSGSFRLRSQMADPRFSRPQSSWVWQVQRGERVILQSASLGPVGANVTGLEAPLGEVDEFSGPSGRALTGVSRQITPRFSQERLTFVVARPSDEIRAAIARFRNLVLVVLALFFIGQITAAALLLRLGLRPLAELRQWVADMREGDAPRRDVSWPTEIRPVAREIEELEGHVERLVARARGQAADLAHAIKTPLTVLRQITETLDHQEAGQLRKQNDRIDAALQRHLAHVRTSGRGTQAIHVKTVVDDLGLALEKTMELKGLSLTRDLDEHALLRCDENDLYEIIGNLMDNACKWAKSRVAVTVRQDESRLSVVVEDDGPGIAPSDVETLMGRGHRADTATPGHGIGLSIVRETVELYAGTLAIDRASLGGARVVLTFAQ
ncbi:MAG: sensor histidine kinase [Pseudomonadota bacterium]